MKKFKLLASIVFLVLSLAVFGQEYHSPVLSDLEGDALQAELIEQYRPSPNLDYGTARDVLYGQIDGRNDSLFGIYTGYGVPMPPSADPSTVVFQDGQGLNAEHVYPRGKGTSSNLAEADMHNLFPARVAVNAARGNFPFAEIPDTQADTWYFWNLELNNPPPESVRDLYSELGNSMFEPRESYKGDIARAIFYVRSVYRPETEAADPLFFASQRTTLCLWHEADPVDEREWERTFAIAGYQQGIPNPFVLDCTLASRAYCADVIPLCTPPPVNTTEAIQTPLDLRINQAGKNRVKLFYQLPYSGEVELVLYNTLGQQILQLPLGTQSDGKYTQLVAVPQSGLLLFQLRLRGNLGKLEQTVKTVVR